MRPHVALLRGVNICGHNRVAMADLRELLTRLGLEVLHVERREAYVVYPDDIGHSRLTTTLIEKKLGTSVTGRNGNTVRKLAALAGGPRA